MKKVLSIVAVMAFMVSSASVVTFKEKEKEKAKAKTEKACTDKKDTKSCSTTAKKSCCSKK